MDVFRMLSSGAKFNRNKNKDSIKLFQASDSVKNTTTSEDLFGPDLSTENKQNNRTKKRPQTDSDKEDLVGDELKEDGHSNISSSSKEDEINAFRNRLRIRAKGDHVPIPSATFSSMNVNKEIKAVVLKNIEASRWKEPTPIQMQAIPVLLAGRDILAAAPTGSGKTASYTIPTLSKLSKPIPNNGIRALLLSPTKELSDQIFREVMCLSDGRKFKICNLKKKTMNLAISGGKQVFSKYDILVATPLRLLTLIRAGVIELSQVQIVVLDEADRLLEIDSSSKSLIDKDDSNDQEDTEVDIEDEDDDYDGTEKQDIHEKSNSKEILKRERSAFLNQVDEILAACPSKGVQRALFSATLGPFVKELASGFLVDPIEVTIGTENTAATTIKQRLVFVGREDGKLVAMRQLIQEGLKPPVLLFVQSIDRAKELFRELIYDGINVDVMHSARSPHQREEVIRRFRVGEIWVLICTDLMARGIDFQAVQMVINYDLPQSAVSYIHRIGRTGRANRAGEAVTFFTEEDMPRMRSIANVVRLSGCDVPDWMLGIKAMSTRNKKKLRRVAPLRRHIGPKPRAAEVDDD